MYKCVHIYIYMYIERERERDNTKSAGIPNDTSVASPGEAPTVNISSITLNIT